MIANMLEKGNGATWLGLCMGGDVKVKCTCMTP